MPNLCYTTASFKGKPEYIYRMVNDIFKSMEWMKDNKYNYYNIGYFLSLNGFNVYMYNEYYSKEAQIQIRCSISCNYPLKIEYYGDYSIIYPIFESAWYMDYKILYLIASIYQVEFSAYSEEPNMEYYEKGKNGLHDTYYYDKVLHLDQDKVEYELSLSGDCPLDYNMPVKNDDQYTETLLDYLDEREIKYEEEIIPEYESNIHGIYYDTVNINN